MRTSSFFLLVFGLALAQDDRPFLGIQLREIDPAIAAEMEIEAASGLVVVSTRIGSPARQAGVLPYDLLLAVNGTPVKDPIAFREAMAPIGVGDEAVLSLSRKGEAVETRARLVTFRSWADEWDLAGKPLLPLTVEGWVGKDGPKSVEALKGSVAIVLVWYST